GFDQARIETGADLVHLAGLDQKLWVALACPTRGIEFDSRTLDLIDTDKDGRIRAPEILAAVQWACAAVRDPDALVKGSDALPLAALNDQTPEGKRLVASARRILANLGKADAKEIGLADAADTARVFAKTRFNGDGVIAADAVEDAEVKQVLLDIMACVGSDTDRSGQAGISQARVDQFFAECQAYAAWCQKGETETAAVLPLGDGTAAAVAACRAVKAKVEDYFARTRLALFDARAQAALNRQEGDYLALAAQDMTISSAEVSGFPLARVEAGRPLPLREGLNPAWSGAMATLVAKAVTPLLGEKDALTEAEWLGLCATLAPYEAWQGAKAGAVVEKLGLARVRAILDGKAKATLGELIAEDRKYEPEALAIADVEKLLRFARDLAPLLNNFVSFRDFYTRKGKAMFQAGTLYLDGRACDLCVHVSDAGKHAALAGLAKTYLAYCDCTRPGGEKMTVAAAFTGGDSDQLMVGRNGLFYDRKGRDWDATITKIVDNPISIRQAFFSPYKKLLRMIEEQVAKRAAAAEAASDQKLGAVAAAAAQADKTAAAAAAPAGAPKKIDVGTVAAIGVALGSIGTFLAMIFAKFAELGWWIPVALLGIVLVISGPSMLIAWMKLRQRNLGPILDANGWAVNARARLNVPFGGALTAVAELPEGSERCLTDVYAEKRSPWPWIVLLLVILGIAGYVLNQKGKIYEWTGYGRQVVIEAPAEAVPAAPAPAEAAPAAAAPAAPAPAAPAPAAP
ncbi:MAG: hypothetical protein GX595_11515, partial [Lentisphaerae bacterium]|nr:hypothetical protein [Lentisphaerota bacterium]